MVFTPKNLIKGLWKELNSLQSKARNLSREDPANDTIGYGNHLNAEIDKRARLINALLDYFFDPEEDEQYISDNRPDSVFI